MRELASTPISDKTRRDGQTVPSQARANERAADPSTLFARIDSVDPHAAGPGRGARRCSRLLAYFLACLQALTARVTISVTNSSNSIAPAPVLCRVWAPARGVRTRYYNTHA